MKGESSTKLNSYRSIKYHFQRQRADAGKVFWGKLWHVALSRQNVCLAALRFWGSEVAPPYVFV
jgi:hypothetical protein